MPKVQSERYPQDYERLMHCQNLAGFLSDDYGAEDYFKWADFGSYEYMQENYGVETNG